MILYQIQLLIWCWVQYLFWQGERNESADYKFSGPSFQTALRQLFISAAKMKFIFYYYQKKKEPKTTLPTSKQKCYETLHFLFEFKLRRLNLVEIIFQKKNIKLFFCD